MKSFDRWFNDSARELAEPESGKPDEDDLPEGLSFAADGITVLAECRHCHNHYQYDGDLDGFDYDVSENCCGSFYCMP